MEGPVLSCDELSVLENIAVQSAARAVRVEQMQLRKDFFVRLAQLQDCAPSPRLFVGILPVLRIDERLYLSHKKYSCRGTRRR